MYIAVYSRPLRDPLAEHRNTDKDLIFTSRRRKVSVRVSLGDMLRLIGVDTLRRVHNVGFLVEWLIWTLINDNLLLCTFNSYKF